MNFVKSILKWWAIFIVGMFALSGMIYFIIEHPNTLPFLKDLITILVLGLVGGVWTATALYISK